MGIFSRVDTCEVSNLLLQLQAQLCKQLLVSRLWRDLHNLTSLLFLFFLQRLQQSSYRYVVS